MAKEIPSPPATDAAPSGTAWGALILRLLLAVVFIYHGWDKVQNLTELEQDLARLRVPQAMYTTYFVAYGEVAGGFLLIPGLLTRVAAYSIALIMAGSVLLVHRHQGWTPDNLPLVLRSILGLVALALGLLGPGIYSLDHGIRKLLKRG